MNEEKLMELKTALENEQKVNEEIALKRDEFEKQNAELFMKQAKIRESISDCKEILRENAEVGFSKDGLKKRLGGIGVRVGTDFIYDEKVAFNWAKEHKLCLKLDTTSFKKIAKTQDLDFVTKEEKITITFPKEIKMEA